MPAAPGPPRFLDIFLLLSECTGPRFAAEAHPHEQDAKPAAATEGSRAEADERETPDEGSADEPLAAAFFAMPVIVSNGKAQALLSLPLPQTEPVGVDSIPQEHPVDMRPGSRFAVPAVIPSDKAPAVLSMLPVHSSLSEPDGVESPPPEPPAKATPSVSRLAPFPDIARREAIPIPLAAPLYWAIPRGLPVSGFSLESAAAAEFKPRLPLREGVNAPDSTLCGEIAAAIRLVQAARTSSYWTRPAVVASGQFQTHRAVAVGTGQSDCGARSQSEPSSNQVPPADDSLPPPVSVPARPANRVLEETAEPKAAPKNGAGPPRADGTAWPAVIERIIEHPTQAAPHPMQPPADSTARVECEAPPPTPRPVMGETADPPAAPAGVPVRELRVRVGEQSGGVVDVRLLKSEGDLKIVLRTPDAVLSRSISEALPELSRALEQPGWSAEGWARAESAAGPAEPGLTEGPSSQSDRQESRAAAARQPESGNPEGGRRQDRSMPAWLEQIEQGVDGRLKASAFRTGERE